MEIVYKYKKCNDTYTVVENGKIKETISSTEFKRRMLNNKQKIKVTK